MIIKPTWKGGFARSMSESKFPHLWKNIVGLWSPVLSPDKSLFNAVRRNQQLIAVPTGTSPVMSKYGWARDYNGSSDVHTIPDNALLSFGDGTTDQPFSIATLVNMDDATRFGFVSKYTIATTTREYLLQTAGDDKIYFSIMDGSTAGYRGRYYNTAVTGMEGTWILIVGTYDGSAADTGIKIYLDGSRVDDTNFSGGSYVAMENQTQDVEIAAYRGFYGNGQIALTAMWRRELTAKDVKELWANPFKLLLRKGPVITKATSAVITGTGAITIGAITVSGAGKIHHVGTGAISIGAVTVSGSGTVVSTITGTGSITLAAVTVAGVGSIHHVGTGTIAVGTITVSGSGTVSSTITGTGAITIGAVTLSGTGTVAIDITGTGAITLGAITLSGVGQINDPANIPIYTLIVNKIRDLINTYMLTSKGFSQDYGSINNYDPETRLYPAVLLEYPDEEDLENAFDVVDRRSERTEITIRTLATTTADLTKTAQQIIQDWGFFFESFQNTLKTVGLIQYDFTDTEMIFHNDTSYPIEVVVRVSLKYRRIMDDLYTVDTSADADTPPSTAFTPGSNPIFNAIMDQIETLIAAMSTGGGYNFDYGSVDDFDPETATYPAVFLHYPTEEYLSDDDDEEATIGFYESMTPVDIEVMPESSVDLDKTLMQVRSDMTKMFYDNYNTLNGLGLKEAEYLGSRFNYRPVASYPTTILLNYLFHHRRLKDNPYHA